jgi:hypothetical protein
VAKETVETESLATFSAVLFSTGGAAGLLGSLLWPHWQFIPHGHADSPAVSHDEQHEWVVARSVQQA